MKPLVMHAPVYALAAALALAAPSARADKGLWIAGTQTVAMQVSAYGAVEPRNVFRVRAGIAGTLRDLTVVPGDEVAASAVLGRLGGAPVDALLASRQSALAGAEAALKAAQQALAIEHQKLAARLSTLAAVDRADAQLEQAKAARERARADLNAARDMTVLRAPRAGRILKLGAAMGERVEPGETILTLLPAKDLWLRASFYGSDADRIHTGMSGVFAPAGGGAPIPVKVRTIVGALRPDGGRTVNLVAVAGSAHWLDGEAGTVTLDVGKVTGVAVPTRALILDGAQWWLVVRTAKGDAPQKVTPGPTRGALTLITQGLAPGTAVVVAGAYLEFHRGISARYQPPD